MPASPEVQLAVQGAALALELVQRIQRNGQLAAEDVERAAATGRELRKALVVLANADFEPDAPVGESTPDSSNSTDESESAESSETSTLASPPAPTTEPDATSSDVTYPGPGEDFA